MKAIINIDFLDIADGRFAKQFFDLNGTWSKI